jgi:hypothetical protein
MQWLDTKHIRTLTDDHYGETHHAFICLRANQFAEATVTLYPRGAVKESDLSYWQRVRYWLRPIQIMHFTRWHVVRRHGPRYAPTFDLQHLATSVGYACLSTYKNCNSIAKIKVYHVPEGHQPPTNPGEPYVPKEVITTHTPEGGTTCLT